MGDLQTKIGELLRLERERHGIKLEDISTSLKIPIENLQAVENGDVAALPSELYFGLFAKSYSEAVGVDYTATVDAIREELATTPPAPEITKKKKAAHDTTEIEGDDEAISESDDSEASTSIFKQKKILYSIAAAVIIVGGYFVVAQLMKDMSTGEKEFSSKMTETDNGSDASSKSPYESYDWNVPEYKKPEPFTLTMTARAESWSTVLADGDTAIFRRLIPGRNYSATAKYRMFLSVAIPSKVDIKLNGQTIYPINPESRRISKVLIDQTNIDSFLTVVTEKPEFKAPPKNPKKTEPTNPLPVSIADQEINNSDANEVKDDER